MKSQAQMTLKHLYYWILTAVTIVFLVILLLIYQISVIAFSNQNLKQVKSDFHETAASMSNSLEKTLYSYSSFTYGESVLSFVNSTPYMKYCLANSINSTLDTLLDSNPYVVDIAILTKDGQCISSNRSSTEVASLRSFIYSIRNIEYKDIPQNQYFKVGSLPYYATMIPFFGLVGSSVETQYCGSCIVVIDPILFLSQFVDTEALPCALQIGPDIILSPEFPVQSTSLVETVLSDQSASAKQIYGYRPFHFFAEHIASSDWNILFAYSEPPMDSRALFLTFGAAALFWLFVMITLFAFLYRKTALPIIDLARQITSIGQSGINKLYPIGRIGEIISLSEHINEMICNLEASSVQKMRIQEQLHTAQANELKAQILFLQSQINPHFLYNTLECVCGLLSKKDILHGRMAIVSLSKLYRYCTEGSVYSMVQEEVDIIQEYLKIISTITTEIRCEIQINPAVSNAVIPKMTLQPLVENAVIHGLLNSKNAEKSISLLFDIGEDNVPYFLLSDNGVGMDPQKIQELNRAFENIDYGLDYKRPHSIGLYNVLLRLRLLSGSPDFFSIWNNSKGGLSIKCLLPFSKEGQRDHQGQQ